MELHVRRATGIGIAAVIFVWWVHFLRRRKTCEVDIEAPAVIPIYAAHGFGPTAAIAARKYVTR